MHTVDSNIYNRFYGFEMFEISWFASLLCSPTHNEFSFYFFCGNVSFSPTQFDRIKLEIWELRGGGHPSLESNTPFLLRSWKKCHFALEFLPRNSGSPVSKGFYFFADKKGKCKKYCIIAVHTPGFI